MNPRFMYKLHGTKNISEPRVLFASYSFEKRTYRIAKKMAREANVRAFVYVSVNQPLFEKLFRRINPKLVVPLDVRSYVFFASRTLFEHEGLNYFKLSRGYSAVLPADADAFQLLSALSRADQMSKRTFNKRASLISELLSGSEKVSL